MAKKRRGSIADALNAFSSTYKMTRGVMQDRDMAAAASEQQTEDTGFTVEQGEQLAAVTNAKDENGNPFYNVNATEDGKYQVTPNKAVFEARGADAELTNSTANIEPGQRFTFQGKTRNTAFTEAEQDSGRMQAMAGVYSKYGDPTKALDMRQKAGQIEMQGVQKLAAEQGLELGKLQIQGAERANADGQRQDAVREELSQAAQEQTAAAGNAGNYGTYQTDLAKVVSGKGIEGMVRAAAGPGVSESEIQQAISAYKQSVGDAQANQNSASMQELYKHQGQIWGGVGGDPAKAAAAYKMAEAEGLPKVIEALKANDVDGANKIWNSSGQGKGLISEVGKDGKGNLLAKVVDPFTGKTQHVNVSDMERQLLSYEKLIGVDRDLQAIKASEAGVENDAARVRIAQTEAAGSARARADAAGDRATSKAEKIAAGNAAMALYKEQNPGASNAQLEAVRRGVVAPFKETKNEYSTNTDSTGMTITRTNKDTGAVDVIDPKTGQIRASIAAPGAAAKPAGPAVGTRRKIGGQDAMWDGKGWKAVK